MFSVGSVELVANQAHPFLSQVRFAGEIEEPGLMEAGLVAVVVGAVDAGEGVSGLAAAEDALAGFGENAVQTVVEDILSQAGNQGIRVLGDKEGVLHGISFLKTPPGLQRVEVVDECPSGNPGANQFEAVVKNLGPAVRKVLKLLIILLISQLFGQLGRSIGAETVFQRMGNGEGSAAAVGHKTGICHIRNISVLHKLLHVHLAGSLDAAPPFQIVLAGSGVHLLDIVIADAAVIGSGKGDGHHIGSNA